VVFAGSANAARARKIKSNGWFISKQSLKLSYTNIRKNYGKREPGFRHKAGMTKEAGKSCIFRCNFQALNGSNLLLTLFLLT
jgi:hypothetical protein